MENKPHMVEQVIKYSDGTETVINYRGVIVDGVLTPDQVMDEEIKTEETPVVAEETTETPADVAVEATEELTA